MTKWLPILLTALTSLSATFSADLQALIAAHPAISTVIAAIGVVVANVMRSPVEKGK